MQLLPPPINLSKLVPSPSSGVHIPLISETPRKTFRKIELCSCYTRVLGEAKHSPVLKLNQHKFDLADGENNPFLSVSGLCVAQSREKVRRRPQTYRIR